MASTVVQGGAVGLLAIAQAWLLSSVIDRVFLGGAGLTHVVGALGVLLFVLIGRALLAWGIEVSASALAQRIKAYLRQEVMQRLLAAGPITSRRFNTTELTHSFSES